MPNSEDKPKAKPIKKINSSLASRSLSLTKLGLKAGAQWAARGISQIIENEDLREKRWKDFLVHQAKSFSSEVGQLKGSLMKAGQLLSMYGEHFFPPEVNQFLKTLQHDSPPVEWKVIELVLLKELGAEKLAALEIEHESHASASLGQVHRAIVRATGEKLALKIQYPGVDKAIGADLKALKMLLGFMQVLPKDLDLTPLFAEVKTMLEQEVNYELEADWTEACAYKLRDDDRYVVPRVFREFSSRKVLATSFEEGVRFDDPTVQSLPQERRNALAASFLDLYFRELFEWRTVQTDAHVGNYRARLGPNGRDQIVLFDFGATRGFPGEFIFYYKRMIHGALLNDPARLREAALRLRFIEEGDDPRLLQLFEDFCFGVVEPFRVPEYDWKKTDLPERTTKIAFDILKNFKLRTPPREIIFLDRKTGGVFIIMGVLGAKMASREILEKYLND